MKRHRLAACGALSVGLLLASSALADGGPGSILLQGQALFPGQSLVSDSCFYHLDMQTDGNLVLYSGLGNAASQARWNSHAAAAAEGIHWNTPFTVPAYTTLQTDGNFVEYEISPTPNAMFASTRLSSVANVLWVQNDGNMDIYSTWTPGSSPEWSTNTGGSPAIGPANCPIHPSYTQIENGTAASGTTLTTECSNLPMSCGSSCSSTYGGSCTGWTWVPAGAAGSCSGSEGKCTLFTGAVTTSLASNQTSGVVTTTIRSRTLGNASLPVQITNGNSGCLDLPSGNTTNGTLLQIYACNMNGQDQTWFMDGAGAIHYGAAPNKCIDLPNGIPNDMTQLQIWDCDNGASQDQQWSYMADDTIRKDGKCVELRNGSYSNGNPVQIYDCNGSTGQTWQRMIGIVPNQFVQELQPPPIIPVQLTDANGGCLDLPGGNTANGTKLQIWGCDATGVNQTWWMDQRGAIHYAADPSMCIDLPNGNPIDQTQLQIWTCDNGASQDQQWSYEGDQTIEKDGKCVELRGGSSAYGTAVQLFDCNGTSGQHWRPVWAPQYPVGVQN